eukprot:SAG31_NODE_1249_length_9118_cov_23.165318_6_plen_761_part_00
MQADHATECSLACARTPMHRAMILSEECIPLNSGKSILFSKYVRYLGCVCGQDQLLMDPEKIRTILQMPEPRKDQTAVRGFLGMCSFWRRWISNYAQISKPLNDLLKKDVDVPSSWKQEQSDAVTALKKKLSSYPVLRQPDPTKPFEIVGDACDYAIGSALIQRHDGKPCVVAFAGRALHAAELNYSVQEKECLSIIYSLQKFRHYVLCSRIKIKILTDHQSLQYLKRPKQAHGRIARWSMILSEYDYEIQYIKGSTNHVGDTLSRLIDVPEEEWTLLDVDDDTVHPFLCMYPTLLNVTLQPLDRPDKTAEVGEREAAAIEKRLNTTGDLPHESVLFSNYAITYRMNESALLDQLEAVHYSKCKDFGETYTALSGKGSKQDESRENVFEKLLKCHGVKSKKQYEPALLRKCILVDELMYYRNNGMELLCIPDCEDANGELFRWKVIHHFHSSPLSGHRGVGKTCEALRRRFHWPGMFQDVRKYIDSCDKCQMHKFDRKLKQGKMNPVQVPTAPGQSYNIDFLTDLAPSSVQKYNKLLVIIDRFSQRVFGLPCRDTDTAAETGALFYNKIVCEYGRGVPLELVSDRDSIFTSAHWQSIQDRCGTSIRMSTARQQSSNGAVERVNPILEEILAMDMNYKQSNWVELLHAALFSINNSSSSVLPGDMTPLQVESGHHPLVPMDTHRALKRKLKKAPLKNRGGPRSTGTPPRPQQARRKLSLLPGVENPSPARLVTANYAATKLEATRLTLHSTIIAARDPKLT